MGVRQLLKSVRASRDERVHEAEQFALAVRPHLAAMTRLAARLGPYDGRDDAVQEALVRAWRHRSRYDPARGAFSAWLLAIVANEARRAASRERRPVPVNRVAWPNTSEDRVDLEQALIHLSVRQRQAIDCFYFAGLSLSETAVVMRCSEGTVKSTLADARHRLRQVLEER